MSTLHSVSASGREASALVAGALAGYLLAWWLHGLPISAAAEIVQAREAGIVSRSILAGYPKSIDLYRYLMTLLLPVAGALAFWLASRPSHGGAGSELFASGFDPHGFSHGLFWPLLGFVVAASWHSSEILMPAWNPYVGAWPFLAEEGVTLSWTVSIQKGGIFGRDFFSLYGPMFVYPLAWLMDLFGNPAAVMERYYKFGLQMVACALMSVLLLRTLRSRPVAILFLLAVAFAYPPLAQLSANTSILRVALPLFALAGVALWIDTRREAWRWIAALLLGQSFLFSQEAALCAFLAACAVTCLDALHRTARYAEACRETVRLTLITAASTAPMLLYLIANGAGAAILDSMVGYPRLVMLGFGGQPFPSMREWLPAGLREHSIHYAVIGIYSVSAIGVCVAWLKGVRSPRLMWVMALTIFGIALFRQALGRSEAEQTFKVMLPAVVLASLWIDDAVHRLGQVGAGFMRRLLAALEVAFISLVVVFGIACDPVVASRFSTAWETGSTFTGKFGVMPAVASQSFHPRIGFAVDPLTQRSLDEIAAFLDQSTATGEPVYFFPNEAAYYHVFDRPSPTRYAIAYFAASFERQRELVSDLAARRPRFVVLSKRTWRVDDIVETVQVPLVVEFLRNNYRPFMSTQTIEVYELI